MIKYKICIITSSRSEYGLLRWLIDEIKNDISLQLQLIATGGHLSQEQGNTYIEIESDGYSIDEKIEMLLSTNTQSGIVKSMGMCSISIADSFHRLSPDLLVVLGDRYELLPICSAALIMGIPIAHISGGDITLGAIDNQVRNAITMMAILHFPGTAESAQRIIRMIGDKGNVYNVGEPGLENFRRLILLDRQELAVSLNIDISKNWILLTFHPETKVSLDVNLQILKNILDTINSIHDIELIVTKANADFGGMQINSFLESRSKSDGFKLYATLGQSRYLSLMKEVVCVIGNSSSGIVEAPYLGKPVINVGNRQNGRYFCSNIISVSGFGETIKESFEIINSNNHSFSKDDYYGDGATAIKIKEHIKNYLLYNAIQ